MPALWTEELLENPIPPLPAEAEAEWRPYADWPPEFLETPARVTDLPEEVSPFFERAGLLTWGGPDDIEAFLSGLPLSEVRAVSNRLEAGKGRSKADVIAKILAKDPDAIRSEIPEIEERWVKDRRGLFENLPSDWLVLADATLPLVTHFVESKFRHGWMSEAASRADLAITMQRDLRCPPSCEARSIDGTGAVPPWFVGCACTIRGIGVRTKRGAIDIGATARIGDRDEFGLGRIEPLGLLGQSSSSPGNAYQLFWSEGHEHQGEWGWYALIHNGRVTAAGHLQRPNEGRVADDGTFVINDWLFGGSLQGAFWAFSSTGEPLLQRETDANLDKCAISADGAYALCTLLHSAGADSSAVILFDLHQRSQIGHFVPELERAEDYSIDPKRRVVALTHDGGAAVEYDFSGKPANPGILKEQRLKNANGYQLRDYVAERLEEAPLGIEETRECIDLLNSALRKGVSTWTQGQAWSMIAQLHEDSGKIADAVSAYEKALEFAPKLPVRRKLKQLRESL